MLLLNFRKGQEMKLITPVQEATNKWFVAVKDNEMKGVFTFYRGAKLEEYNPNLAKKLGLSKKTWENKKDKLQYIVRYEDMLPLKKPVGVEKPVRGARRATPEEEKNSRIQYCLSFIEDDDYDYFEGFEKSFQEQMFRENKYHQLMIEADCLNEFYDYIQKKER